MFNIGDLVQVINIDYSNYYNRVGIIVGYSTLFSFRFKIKFENEIIVSVSLKNLRKINKNLKAFI